MDYSGELAINIVFVVYCCVARLKGHKAPVTACRFVPERDLLITRYLHTMLLSSHVVDSVNSVYSCISISWSLSYHFIVYVQ